MTASIEDRPVDGAKRLALYLKEHPEGISRLPAELAVEFGLPPAFVAQVLRGLIPPRKVEPPAKLVDLGRQALFELRSIWDVVLNFVSRIVVITLYATAALILVRTVGIRDGVMFLDPSISREENNRVLLSLAGIHMILFYASGNLRAVWLGVVHCFLMLLSLEAFLQLFVLRSPFTFGWLVIAVVQSILLTTLYGVFSTFAAAAGSIVKYRHQDYLESRMERQELLARLFELEQRLAQASPQTYRPVRLLPAWLWIPFENAGTLLLAFYGSIIGVAQLAVDVTRPERLQPEPGIFLLCLLMTSTVTYIAAGYTATNYRLAVARSLLVYGIIFLFELIPINGYGPQNLQFGAIFFSLILSIVMSSAGYLVAQVEQRTAIGERLAAGDPAALLAEVVRFEWRLKSRAQEVVVVNVDAARSAEMKAACDPLVAEYSFREYQEFLKMLCDSNHGFVYATAGDGAILAFQTCENAFRCAREIQTNISYFNEHVNRMKSKFRLRVGIHMGEIAGDIREVEFTEVIDIAAHVQGAAPIRGIVVTKPVAERLHNEHLIPLREPVDGYEVLLAYNPTVEM